MTGRRRRIRLGTLGRTHLIANRKPAPEKSHFNEIESLAREVEKLATEMAKMGFTVIPMIPLPIDGNIALKLSSAPTPLAGTITATETDGKRPLERL
jgi:hypothetical protein